MKDESLIEIKEAETNKEEKETENYATEVLKFFNTHSMFMIKGLIIGWVSTSIFLAALYFWNDQKWRDLFNSYDYISQDGEGINNANYGEQGDLNNGATSEIEEE